MNVSTLILSILWLCRLGDGSAAPRAGVAEVPQALAAAEPALEVIDIAFTDMFVRPIGPRGAEYTPRLKALAGKRVRLKGYMVRRASYTPGRCVLTQVPVVLHEREMGLADDLPVNATWVDMPGGRGGLGHIGEVIEVTGVLSLGPRRESDGRVSHVRIAADAMAVPPRASGGGSP